MLVHFVECSGSHAKETLKQLEQELIARSEIISLELLENLEQPEVFLLVIKSPLTLVLNPPQGTRVWLFKNV